MELIPDADGPADEVLPRLTVAGWAARRPAPAGYSVVELLIAAALLLFIVMGLIPLFAQSMVSNLAGQDATEAANAARSRLEELLHLSFDSEPLTILDGTERIYEEYYTRDHRRWFDGGEEDEPTDARVLWRRVTTVRQYHSSDLETPLAATAGPELVHLKEIEVRVASTREGGMLGVGKRFSTRVFKSQ